MDHISGINGKGLDCLRVILVGNLSVFTCRFLHISEHIINSFLINRSVSRTPLRQALGTFRTSGTGVYSMETTESILFYTLRETRHWPTVWSIISKTVLFMVIKVRSLLKSLIITVYQ